MKIRVFKPEVHEPDRFAVAVMVEGGIPMIIQTYSTKEQLETGYKTWYNLASKGGIAKPVPIERVDENWKCKILEDMVARMSGE